MSEILCCFFCVFLFKSCQMFLVVFSTLFSFFKRHFRPPVMLGLLENALQKRLVFCPKFSRPALRMLLFRLMGCQRTSHGIL